MDQLSFNSSPAAKAYVQLLISSSLYLPGAYTWNGDPEDTSPKNSLPAFMNTSNFFLSSLNIPSAYSSYGNGHEGRTPCSCCGRKGEDWGAVLIWTISFFVN